MTNKFGGYFFDDAADPTKVQIVATGASREAALGAAAAHVLSLGITGGSISVQPLDILTDEEFADLSRTIAQVFDGKRFCNNDNDTKGDDDHAR